MTTIPTQRSSYFFDERQATTFSRTRYLGGHMIGPEDLSLPCRVADTFRGRRRRFALRSRSLQPQRRDYEWVSQCRPSRRDYGFNAALPVRFTNCHGTGRHVTPVRPTTHCSNVVLIRIWAPRTRADRTTCACGPPILISRAFRRKNTLLGPVFFTTGPERIADHVHQV